MDGKSFLFRAAYFVSAYLPLFIVLGAFLAYKYIILFCFLPVFAFIFTLAFINALFKAIHAFPKVEIAIETVNRTSSAYLFYFISYLPMFLEFMLPTVMGALLVLFIYGVLFLLYLTAGWKLINPILALLGYKAAIVEDKAYREYLVYFKDPKILSQKKIFGRLIDPTIIIVLQE